MCVSFFVALWSRPVGLSLCVSEDYESAATMRESSVYRLGTNGKNVNDTEVNYPSHDCGTY